MMKRFLVTILSVAIAANLVACGCGAANNNVEAEQDAVVEEDPTMNQPAAAPEDTPAEMPTPSVDSEMAVEDETAVTGDTVGAMLAEEFHALKAENAAITAQEMGITLKELESEYNNEYDKGIIIWQDSKGFIYKSTPNSTPKKIATSLAKYISKRKK